MVRATFLFSFQLAQLDARATMVIVLLELAGTAVVVAALYAMASRFLRTAAPTPEGRTGVSWTVRRLLLAVWALSGVGIVGYNGWLIARDVNVPEYTTRLLRSATVETWEAHAVTFGELGLAAFGLIVGTRILRRLLQALQTSLSQRHRLDARNLQNLFVGLDRAIINTGWLMLAALACWLFGLRQAVVDSVLLVVRVYVIVAVGLVLVRATGVIVDVLDGWGHSYAQRRSWRTEYDHLRRLLPTLRACVEYALWVGIAALVFVQFGPVHGLASWGPRLAGAIGIFFAGRVMVEIGQLELERRMLSTDRRQTDRRQTIDEMAQRRRATMLPLIRSVFTYLAYFGTAVLILAALSFNPMPFLAGAGVLGLVVGFGAQSLINDVVSGFFILFENVYLVGDLVEVDKAKGVVESIEFRVTKIRDDEGRLHVIRNGDMKPIVNYSKEYAMAVVPVEVAYDADLRAVFTTLREAGQRVRAGDRNVLAETRIDGIMAFGASAMTVRTSTRVRPGSHEGVAAALRLAIKEAFDRHAAADEPRQTLIPGAVRAGSRS